MNLKKCFLIFSLFFLAFPLMSLEAGERKAQVLKDGKQAFPEIIKCIQNSEKSILINMFIWRDDEIGNLIASEILAAAERGVKVSISKDLYGTVCEHCEENTLSFFHKNLSFTDKIKVASLKILYNPARTKKAKDKTSVLYEQILNHKNITVENKFKADHSKFYIFDDSTLILGGVNIEDKENGKDMSGRVYEDFMIKLEGESFVKEFNQARKEGTDPEFTASYFFGMNVKEGKKKARFQMEDFYLDLINSSEKELTIVMSYFSPLKKFTKAILAASERGVDVKIVIPAVANFQDNSNKKTISILQKKSKGKIKIYLTPKMMHTKMMFNEKYLSFGSCNITKKAFTQLDELNFFAERNWEKVYEEVNAYIQKTIEESELLPNKKKIKFNRLIAWMEGFLV